MTSGNGEGSPSRIGVTFEDIVWSEEPPLRDLPLWDRNITTVKLLLENGGIPSNIIDIDYAQRIPSAYDFDGVPVEFLPHWTFYKVGELSIDLPPTDAETLQSDVE